MSIKKIITVVCDGPCGTTITQSWTPSDWSKLTIQVCERLANKEKPKVRPLSGYFCQKCTASIEQLIASAHFSLGRGREITDATAKSEELLVRRGEDLIPASEASYLATEPIARVLNSGTAPKGKSRGKGEQ